MSGSQYTQLESGGIDAKEGSSIHQLGMAPAMRSRGYCSWITTQSFETIDPSAVSLRNKLLPARRARARNFLAGPSFVPLVVRLRVPFTAEVSCWKEWCCCRWCWSRWAKCWIRSWCCSNRSHWSRILCRSHCCWFRLSMNPYRCCWLRWSMLCRRRLQCCCPCRWWSHCRSSCRMRPKSCRCGSAGNAGLWSMCCCCYSNFGPWLYWTGP